MDVSLQAAAMGRWSHFFARVQRVLELAERALEVRVGAPLDAAVFGNTLAFRWVARGVRGQLEPIEAPHLFELDDLLGVDRAVQRLIDNTEQFLLLQPSNHVLLYGERGTGKSSAVKGLLARYGARGLRMIEVHKDDLLHLPDVLAAIRGLSHRFLIFCDDLSFEAGESQYRELKAALEGSLVAPPENVRIIATSNRRHLMPESMADNRGAQLDDRGDLHLGESADEKLALSDRFGLVIGFYSFDQATYLEIVDHYALKAGVDTPRDSLHAQALRWALHRSSRSGRTAKQFVDDLAGRKALEKPPHRD
ncbi:MAG: ATP-binding protein [Myxococcales bacterium]|nr:ATP-binding protein [Myxococcales bacterium]